MSVYRCLDSEIVAVLHEIKYNFLPQFTNNQHIREPDRLVVYLTKNVSIVCKCPSKGWMRASRIIILK